MKQKNKKEMKENTKRVLSAIILIPIVIALLIFGNTIWIDLALMLMSIIALNEFYNAVKKVANPVKPVRICSSNNSIFTTFFILL